MLIQSDNNRVLLECGDTGRADLRAYCVWFGPVTDPMPEFVVSRDASYAEFTASMRRLRRNHTIYVLKTTMLASCPDEDINPLDRYSSCVIQPDCRLFRVWLKEKISSFTSSFVVQAKHPELVVPIVVDHSTAFMVTKVTELPCNMEDDFGSDCGHPSYRMTNCFGRSYMAPNGAGEFMIEKYASIYDERKLKCKSKKS